MAQQKIQQFNQKLVDEKIDITIVEYVIEINDLVYHIDLDFLNDFIDFVGKDDYIVHHNLLDKYEVQKITDTTGHVKRLFDRHSFTEGNEYIIKPSQVGRQTEYFLKPKFFKFILIRSMNTRKYADYYLFLEEAIFYYNQYEKLKLENKINEINKLKLLKLQKSETLDNFVIVKDDRKKTFKYATIKGSTKNLRETLNDLDLTDENVIFRVYCPYAMNFNKRIKEELKVHYKRQKVYVLKNKYGEILQKWLEEEDEEPAFTDDEEYLTTCNRWFKIKDMSENDFLDKIKEINEMRFE